MRRMSPQYPVVAAKEDEDGPKPGGRTTAVFGESVTSSLREPEIAAREKRGHRKSKAVTKLLP